MLQSDSPWEKFPWVGAGLASYLYGNTSNPTTQLGWALGAGRQPVLLLPSGLPRKLEAWGGGAQSLASSAAWGWVVALAAGSHRTVAHFSLEVPRTHTKPLIAPTPTTGVFPAPNHSASCSFHCLVFLQASPLSEIPHLSLLFLAPGPGTSCRPIPAPAAALATATPQPPQPRAAPLVPAVKTPALAPEGNGPAGG